MNPKVILRIRPLNAKELSLQKQNYLKVKENELTISKIGDEQHIQSSYKYDHIFNQGQCQFQFQTNQMLKQLSFNEKQQKQQTIYKVIGNDLIKNIFEGKDACLYFYGITGTGKTYTLLGTYQNRGLLFRIINELFHIMKIKNLQQIVTISVFKIYNQAIQDMLSNDMKLPNLKVKQQGQDVVVQGLTKKSVSNIKEAEQVIQQGNLKNHKLSCLMGQMSSRAHLIYSLQLKIFQKISKITFVDLAGSEKNKYSDSKYQIDTKALINRSIGSFHTIIKSLSSNQKNTKNKFIPYRDSKLTFVLKNTLCPPNCHTTFIFTVSPLSQYFFNTQQTLKFSSLCRKIRQNTSEIQQSTKKTDLFEEKLCSQSLKKQSQQFTK